MIDVDKDWSTWLWMSQGYANVPTAIMLTMTTGLSLLYSSQGRPHLHSQLHDERRRGIYAAGSYSVVGSADSDPTEYTDVIMPLSELDNEEWTSTEATISACAMALQNSFPTAPHPSGFPYSLSLKNVGIDEGAMLSAPDVCGDIIATPGSNGASRARITFVAPSVTVGGDALGSISRIVVKSGRPYCRHSRHSTAGCCLFCR